jgi:hypothetical protein
VPDVGAAFNRQYAAAFQQQAEILRKASGKRTEAVNDFMGYPSIDKSAGLPALTAAASPAQGPYAQFLRHTDRWQNEAWGYLDTVGEFRYGIGTWLAGTLSRVRLRAGQRKSGMDEPSLVDTGLAAELVEGLGAGVGGQSEIMRRLTVQISVPGECYLIGETVNGIEQWQVRAVDEIRAAGVKDADGHGRPGPGYQVVEEYNVTLGIRWRDLAPDSLVVRIWRPHDRFYHLADSPARSALTTMRELELVNRHITSQYLSRLASAGVLILPQEVSFPAREEFAEAQDPFMMEWIEIAAEAIAKPGTASALIPIPLRVPAEYVKDIAHLDFTLKLDDKILDKRESAIKRLATQMDVPSDVMLGLGDMNHWSAWASEESGLKAHIAPTAEIICDALTRGYLWPRLLASGMDPDEVRGQVVWYDMSELTIRPDRSANALNAYDRLELSGTAFRREMGFDEDDAPTEKDLVDLGLKALIRLAHGAAPGALDALVGTDLVNPASVGPGATDPSKGIAPEPGQGPEKPPDVPASGPPSGGEPPADSPPPQAPSQASAETRRLQASTQHAFRLLPDGRWDLRHPAVCNERLYSCPFTHAVASAAPVAAPAGAGTHLCHLGSFGNLVVDGQAPYLDLRQMQATVLEPRRVPAVNGRG